MNEPVHTKTTDELQAAIDALGDDAPIELIALEITHVLVDGRIRIVHHGPIGWTIGKPLEGKPAKGDTNATNEG
jgi:hypothetical protein